MSGRGPYETRRWRRLQLLLRNALRNSMQKPTSGARTLDHVPQQSRDLRNGLEHVLEDRARRLPRELPIPLGMALSASSRIMAAAVLGGRSLTSQPCY